LCAALPTPCAVPFQRRRRGIGLHTLRNDQTRAVNPYDTTLRRWDTTITANPHRSGTGHLKLRTQQVEERCRCTVPGPPRGGRHEPKSVLERPPLALHSNTRDGSPHRGTCPEARCDGMTYPSPDQPHYPQDAGERGSHPPWDGPAWAEPTPPKLLRNFISFYHQAYRAAVWCSRHDILGHRRFWQRGGVPVLCISARVSRDRRHPSKHRRMSARSSLQNPPESAQQGPAARSFPVWLERPALREAWPRGILKSVVLRPLLVPR
jgi:hypothetical protein